MSMHAATPRIPGYQILGVLGHGGIGIVYRARDLKLGRLVALKMLASNLASNERMVSRFQAEAQSLARLQHPNIAQIYEVGEAAGVPFIALEYVAGGDLAERIAKTPLTPPAAAALVETLARAIHYSHQRDIIHRDLKPANVLLSGDGTAKITDFGLAKYLLQDSDATRTGEVLGTPGYMAPEQAGGVVKNLGPACDIYALGSILYELLCGRAPFRAPEPAQTLLMVLTREPVPLRQLQPKLPRDLETICLKCLEKAPRRRYPSALELAEELGRFRAGHPIRARPVRPWEQAVKWARRHPARAALILVSTLAGAGLLLESAWYGAQLKRELDRSRTLFTQGQGLARWVLFDHTDAIIRLAGATTAQQALVERISSYLHELEHNSGEDMALSADIATAYERLAAVQGDPNHFNLGKSDHALESYRKALALREKIQAANPGDLSANLNLILTRMGIAGMQILTGAVGPALHTYDAVLSELRSLDASRLREPRVQSALILALQGRGDALQEAGKPEQALASHREALDAVERLFGEQTKDPGAPYSLSFAHSRIGRLLQAAGDLSGAEIHYRRVLAYADVDAPVQRNDARAARRLSVALLALGDLLTGKEDWSAAQSSYRKAVEIRRNHAKADPNSASVQRDLAVALERLGLALQMQRDYQAALLPMRESLSISEQLAKLDPDNLVKHRDLRIKHGRVGSLLLWSGDAESAARHFHQELALAQALLARNPQGIVELQAMAEACDNLGNLQVLTRDATGNERTAAYNRAIGWYRKGIDVLTQIERLAPASTDQRKQRDALLRKIETLQQELAQEPEKPHPQGDESRSGG